MVHVILLCSYSILLCVISAFGVQCPHSSQRRIQAKVFCNGSEISRYSCLYDMNNHVYNESCDSSPEFVRPGKRYVFKRSRTDNNCSSERYQPCKFWTNELSDCVYQKSLCSEIGQKNYKRRSTKEDSTCSCDYNKGYGFVTQPTYIHYCIPSKEDCSCYLVHCADNNTLSPDYICRPGLIQKNENKAENMDTSYSNTTELPQVRTTRDISDEDDEMVVGGRCIITILIICYIVIAFISAIKINYCLPNKWCCTDGKRPEMPPLRDRIISNFSSLIRHLDSKTVFPHLLKLNLVNKQEFQKERNNKQLNRFILIKLIDNCGKLDKKIESILYKQKRIHRILRGPISARRWPKRDEAECREKLTSAQKLQDDLQPGEIIDFFFENFIFNLKQYKKCIEKEDTRMDIMECFKKKATKTLSKGSFECLLVALQKTESNEILLELEKNLSQGVFFKVGECTDLCHVEIEPNIPTVVHFMISADGHDNLMAIIPADTIHECSTWFIKELAMYPETVTEKHIVLVPLVENIKDRIKDSIKNERFNNLLERLFCKKEVISLAKDISTVKVTLQWGCPTEGGYSGKLEKLQFSQICKYNQPFLKREMQTQTLYQAFKERGITLCTDDIKNDTAMIIRSICENNYHKTFLEILKEKNFSIIYNRLRHCDPYLLRENIMCNISQLVALDLDYMTHMQDIFVNNKIFTKEFFENIKKKCDSLELQNTLVLVKIIQSGTDAMYLYVLQLRESGNDTVADKLMSTEAQDQIKYTDSFDDLKHQRTVLFMKYDVTMERIGEIDHEKHRV